MLPSCPYPFSLLMIVASAELPYSGVFAPNALDPSTCAVCPFCWSCRANACRSRPLLRVGQAEKMANAPRTSAQAAAVELMNAASCEQYITHSGNWKPPGAAMPPEVPSAESEDAGGKGYKPEHSVHAAFLR